MSNLHSTLDGDKKTNLEKRMSDLRSTLDEDEKEELKEKD